MNSPKERQKTEEYKAGEKSVLILHRHALLCEGLARIISEAGFRTIQGVAGGRGMALPVMPEAPDIIIVDCEIPDSENSIIKALKESAPQATLIVLTTPHPGHSFMQAISAGAQGYLSTNLSAEMFVSLLKLLAGGNLVIAREQMSEDGEMFSREYPAAYEHLSSREKEVLALIGQGATNREVAEELIMSEHTVKVHLRTILNKLNLRNRQQAAAYATQIGLVSDVSNETRLHAGPADAPVRVRPSAVVNARN